MIRLENVTKQYQDVLAVNSITITIQKGEIYGIIGYSGAGKSSLIRMINLLEQPTHGQVIVDDVELTSISKKELRHARQSIGMIFQHFNLLWSRTVFDNIAFPLELLKYSKEAIQVRVNELIKLVGLEGREQAYPSQLSGGEKQRVGIARALANNPKVLLCDEPTSALDPKTTDSILRLLKDINRKLAITIVIITHEMYVIKTICDKVAVMEKGSIIEEGDVFEVFTHPKTKTTRDFVRELDDQQDDEEVISHLRERYPSSELLKLSYLKDHIEGPYINELIERYHVKINILHARITGTTHGSYGTLFLLMDGNHKQEAIDYLKENEILVEVVCS